ncbi:MAG: NAD(P)-dependent oxidoreductase [Actinomycetota bacterium]|nr:NAD(P)-dependent oxidoreductase [Actinomycetota bacterium]
MDWQGEKGSSNGNHANGSKNARRPRQGIRHVLVIGGAGYVGSVLVRKLLDRGHTVTVMDALMYGDHGIRDLYGRPTFRVVEGDLRNVESVVRATNGADAVVHLGALVGDPACALDEKLTMEINLLATRTVAEVARGLAVKRLVFASTCGVYGADDGLLDEESPLNPVSLYSRTKMESERMVLSMSGPDFAPVVLRFGTFYGASPRPRFDLVVNLLVARAVAEGEITIFGGDQWRPFVHVDDGAEAILRCLDVPSDLVRGKVFNVGSDDQNHTLAQIAQTIVELVPGVRIIFEGGRGAAEANYRVSFARIRSQLGFLPHRSLAEGLAEIKEAIEQGVVTDYAEERYSNYKVLTRKGEMLRRSGSLPANVGSGR